MVKAILLFCCITLLAGVCSAFAPVLDTSPPGFKFIKVACSDSTTQFTIQLDIIHQVAHTYKTEPWPPDNRFNFYNPIKYFIQNTPITYKAPPTDKGLLRTRSNC